MKVVMRLTLTGAFLMAVCSPLIATASASAAECPGSIENGGVQLCSEGHAQTGKVAFSGAFSGKTTENTRFVRLEGEAGTFECEAGTVSKGSFEVTTGKVAIVGPHIEYTGCSAPDNGGACEIVGSKINVDGGEGLGTGPGLSGEVTGTEAVLLAGGTSNLWTAFKIGKHSPSCLLEAENKIKGEVQCTLKEGAKEAIIHDLICEKEGLRDVGTRLRFSTEFELKLASGKKWSLQKR